MSKTCPLCQRIHPDSAMRCECGYQWVPGAPPLDIKQPQPLQGGGGVGMKIVTIVIAIVVAVAVRLLIRGAFR